MAVAGLEWWAEPRVEPFLHPGRAAGIIAKAAAGAEERVVGWAGELHPLVARAWELPGGAAALELDADALAELAEGRIAVYRDVTSFPAVLQDIAVVVPEEVTAADVERIVRAGGGELLDSLSIFDVYRGAQLGEGKKSLALRLEFRALDRTLTDEEVAERRAAIEQELRSVGGALRA
jgi:phenylalanyl-tRNA synthetase beta chain